MNTQNRVGRMTIVLLAAVLAAGTALAEDFFSWQKKMSVTFAGYNPPGGATTLTNFPALVVLSTNISGFSYGDFLSLTNQDLRFTASDMTTELCYEIESWNTNGSSYVWVQVPNLVDMNTCIWAYWGKNGTNAPACTTNGATWSEGFKGVYHFRQTNSAPDLRDSSVNAYHGINSNTTSTAAGRIGYAETFPGANQYITLTNANTYLPVINTPITLSTWFKANEIPAASLGDRIVTLPRYSGSSGFSIGLGSTNQLELFRANAVGTPTTTPFATIASNNWYHTAIAFNGSQFACYLNGRLLTNVTDTLTNSAATVKVCIGDGPAGGGAIVFNGTMDEFVISSVARSSNWVWACYMNQASNILFNNNGSAMPGSAPVIQNLPFSNLATNGATFNGWLVSTGASATAVGVLWGEENGEETGAWAHTNGFDGLAWTNNSYPSTNIVLEPDRTYYYTFGASNTTTNVVAGSPVSFITGEVTVEATDNEAQYPTNTATFTICRPATATNEALTVAYTLTGSASNGVDYGLLPNSVTLTPGATSIVLTVTSLVDLDTTNEHVVLTLLGGNYPTGALNTATVTILTNAATVRIWDGGGSTANASEAANWSGNTLPASDSHIVLNGTTNKSMTWNGGVGGLPNTVASWTQSSVYAGTVTFATVYPGQGAFTNFTVSGDMTVSGGILMQVGNGGTESYKFDLAVNGNFTLAAGVQINVEGKGYSGDSGPGAGGYFSGGTHGGMGVGVYGGTPSANTYGSITNPVRLGSGGGGGTSGGGAIRLSVGGLSTINGTLNAGGQVLDTFGPGSGGSIFLTTGTLAGNGTLKANGGNGGDIRAGAGGGRIAVILTSGTNFGSIAMQAFGSYGWMWMPGSAGTVYKETAIQGAGHGELIIDNNGVGAVSRSVTLMPPGVNLSDFSRITIRNQGNLGVTGNGALLNFGTAMINGSGASSAFVTLYSSAAAVTFPSPFTLDGYTLQIDSPMTYTGNWTIASTGCLSHEANYGAESYKLNLTIIGNLTVNTGGQVNVEGKGYSGDSGPGAGTTFSGGTHGGMGVGVYGGTASANTYGSITGPTSLGSGGGGGTSGGGAIRLSVSGLTTINGTVSAGGTVANAYGPGAGGSVLLTTATLAGNGIIKANGGNGGDIRAGAGGGRVAVILTSGTSFGSVAMQAFGSVGNTAGSGSAGTVYKQMPTGLTPNKWLVINNNGVSPAANAYTYIKTYWELVATTVTVTNNARLVMSTNAVFGNLYLQTANSVLDLNGYSLTIKNFRHAFTPGYVTNYGHIVWSPPGTMLQVL